VTNPISIHNIFPPDVTLKLARDASHPGKIGWKFTTPAGLGGQGWISKTSSAPISSECFGDPSVKYTATPVSPLTWDDVKDDADVTWTSSACESPA
jgi:hypothetical protein